MAVVPTLDPAEKAFIDQSIAQHSGRPGALLGILEAIQERNRKKYLPEDALRYIARQMEIPLARMYSIATFYALFNLTPQGEHTICICRGTAIRVTRAICWRACASTSGWRLRTAKTPEMPTS
jgi:NADH:ubiquinone oxidoreductase subunit E